MKKRYPQTILATICIPWDENDQFEEEIFRKAIRIYIERGVYHLYLFGSAGEGYAVTDSQFARIVEVFAEEMSAPHLHPMIGLISLSLPIMKDRLMKAYSFGIRDFQFVLPSWGVVSDQEMVDFFHAVCDPFPDCRFLHYNLLKTKRLVTAAEYRMLANEIPNLVGAKFTTEHIRIIHELMSEPCPLQYFIGELGFSYASTLGECGLLISIGGSNLQQAWSYFEAAINKETDKVLNYTSQLYTMVAKFLEITGLSKMDSAYDKVLYRLNDHSFPLRILPPYQSCTVDQFDQYLLFLKEQLPQWIELN